MESLGDEKKSTDATYGSIHSSLGSIPNEAPSSRTSSSGTDADSIISGTTYTGSSESGLHYTGQSYESSTHEIPYIGHFENVHDDISDHNYEYESFLRRTIHAQSVQQEQPNHETVALLKERGYDQDPRTGLFYTYSENGPRMPKFPGVNDTNDSSINNAIHSRQYIRGAHHHGYMGQARQGPYPRPERATIVKRQRRTNTKPNNAIAPKTNTKPKQPRKTSRKNNDEDPNKPKSKRGRKKGQRKY